MAVFPRITSPCPYKDRLATVMDGDFCRMCQRKVFDLNDMDDAGRKAMLAGCRGDICVSYRLPLRPALAAIALASVATPAYAACPGDEMEIIVGGVRQPDQAEMIEVDDHSRPELPVVYERATTPALAARVTATVAAIGPKALPEPRQKRD
ncbi:hypothetical protein QH494_01385 [Sphingomonas sp. AR_OL41]|uniref:hypothetical protein n=1 Tax=Sphingomonas sp. AR_OL41 TaxID=3042729 RepID=UPI0024817F33|nr:hypothetical protein [Sphingomonas sp. AR_OL41]MDH7970819.1 hypothetical protein [Sphingomonas sp. AR_OL41]